MINTGISDYSYYQLLWFRPLSPLNYCLPSHLLALNWYKTLHLPTDYLQAHTYMADSSNTVQNKFNVLNHKLVVVLSSPTAAHIAAQWNWQAINTIAVMGNASKAAWQNAGGSEPVQWIISPTGESMGLFNHLSCYSNITVVRANQGRNDLINHLKALNIKVNILIAYHKYDLTQTESFQKKIHSIHNTTQPIALYFTSTDQVLRVLNSVSNIEQTEHQTFLSALLKNSLVLVSHQRIKETAIKLNFNNVLCI
jgi:uroporphyrinogen-III synthase